MYLSGVAHVMYTCCSSNAGVDDAYALWAFFGCVSDGKLRFQISPPSDVLKQRMICSAFSSIAEVTKS